MDNNYNPLNNNPNNEDESEIKRKIMIAKIISVSIPILLIYSLHTMIISKRIEFNENTITYISILIITISLFAYTKYTKKYMKEYKKEKVYPKKPSYKRILIILCIYFLIEYIPVIFYFLIDKIIKR